MHSQHLSRFFILLKLARSKSQLMEARVGWYGGGNCSAGHVLFRSQPMLESGDEGFVTHACDPHGGSQVVKW